MGITLTSLQRRIDELRAMPESERREAATAVLALADEVLTPAVGDATAIGAWTRLARAVSPSVAPQQTREQARETAYWLAGGNDPLAAVRAAQAADKVAQGRAEEARAALRAAAVQAVHAGMQPTAVADAAKVSRQVIYDWTT